MRAAFALMLVLLGAVGPARAETAAVLPAGGDERLPARLRGRAVAALRAALGDEGVRVLGPGAVRARVDDGVLRGCRKTDCADDLARAVGADFAAGVAVWAEGPSGRPATVAVSLVTPAGVAYPGTSEVRRGDLALATRTALAAARAKQRLGPGPWIHVHGTPVGAQVRIDGTVVGVLPHRGAIAPGRHVVSVRLRGYRPLERTIDVRMRDQEEVAVEVALEADPEAASGPHVAHPEAGSAGPDGASAGRAPVHRWGPIALGAAGLGLLAVDAVALARRTCDFRDASGTCRRGRRLRTGPFAAYAAVGGAAVAGAVLWLVFAPGGDERPQGDAGGTEAGGTEVRLGPFGVDVITRF